LFALQDPVKPLQDERMSRYAALEKMFSLCANGAANEELSASVNQLGRLAAAGQIEM
jgi:hypothetical protein